MKASVKSYCSAWMAVLLWSTVASAFKIALAGMHFMQLLCISSGVSFMVLTFFSKTAKRKNRSMPSSKTLLVSALTGLLNPLAYYMALFRAYELIPAQLAQPLNYTWPMIMACLSGIFLRQHIGRGMLLAMFISFCGVVLISAGAGFGETGSIQVQGIWLALLSALLWAVFWMIHTNKGNAPSLLTCNFFFGFLFAAILCCFKGLTSPPAVSSLLAAVYIGCFEMGITFLLWSSALKHTASTALISNLIYIVPFLSLFIIRLVLGESILFTTISGCALVVIGQIIIRLPSFPASGRLRKSKGI